MQNQLEINRSIRRKLFRLPAWVNFALVVGTIMLISAISFWTVYQAESTLQVNVTSKLKTILRIEFEAVREWITSEKQLASFLASDSELAELILAADIDAASGQPQFAEHLANVSTQLTNKTCLLMTNEGKVVASYGEPWLAKRVRFIKNGA